MSSLSAYGPWAVVTGASSGIGRAFAERCAADHLNLVLAARSTDRLDDLAARLRTRHGVDTRVITTDLSRPGAAAALVTATDDLDIGLLVSNAGTARPGNFLDQDRDDLGARLTLNTVTHLDLAHAYGKRLTARGAGAIVLVAALGARHGIPNMAHESAAKAYVLNLGEALHHELAPAGVKVTVMLPGNVDTAMIDKVGLDRDRLPIRPLPVATAVRQTVAALHAGRATVIPDRRLRLLTHLTPRTLSIRMNARLLAADALTARSLSPATPADTRPAAPGPA